MCYFTWKLELVSDILQVIVGGGGHGDHSKRLFSAHRGFYDGQWPLTGCYFKHCSGVFVVTLEHISHPVCQ